MLWCVCTMHAAIGFLQSDCAVQLLDREHTTEAAAVTAAVARLQYTRCRHICCVLFSIQCSICHVRAATLLELFHVCSWSYFVLLLMVHLFNRETREYDDDYDDQYDDVQPSVTTGGSDALIDQAPAVTSELAACCCAVHKCALISSVLHSGALRVAQCSWLQRSHVTTAVCSHMRACVHAAALGQAAVSCTQPLPRRVAALAAQLLNCCQQLQC
jgi:hypothetical protein